MNPELQKILSKYAELDRLAESGDDVVADLRKEINNLELAYLKDTVLPKVAKTFGGLVDGLRCDIDGNLTRYQDKNVEYAFGTSINMVMLKGEVDATEYKEDRKIITVNEPPATSSSSIVIPDLRIEDYSDKAIVVRGDTRQISELLVANNGILNFRLQGGAGWIFPNKRRSEIERLLQPYMPTYALSYEKQTDKKTMPENYDDSYENSDNSGNRIIVANIHVGKIVIMKDSLAEMLRKYIEAVGPNRVFDLRIPYFGDYLVSQHPNPKYHNNPRFKNSYKLLTGGLWLNTISNTETKIRQIRQIAKRLGIEVTIIYDNGTSEDVPIDKKTTDDYSSVPKVCKDTNDNIHTNDVEICPKNTKTEYISHQIKKQEKWIDALLNMRGKSYKGFTSPHKAIFMLTLIDAIEKRNITDTRIYPTRLLSYTFDAIWKKNVPDSWPFKSNFFQPYMHMSGESFYTLIYLDKSKNVDINLGWTFDLVNRTVAYAILNQELFNLLHDNDFANKLRSKLIEHYIVSQTDNPIDNSSDMALEGDKTDNFNINIQTISDSISTKSQKNIENKIIEKTEVSLISLNDQSNSVSEESLDQQIIKSLSEEQSLAKATRKIIFLLTLVDSVYRGILTQEFVYMNTSLETEYKRAWHKYAPDNWIMPSVHESFVAFGEENWFTLYPTSNIGKLFPQEKWNASSFKMRVQYGKIDHTLFEMLHESKFRMTLKDGLINLTLHLKPNVAESIVTKPVSTSYTLPKAEVKPRDKVFLGDKFFSYLKKKMLTSTASLYYNTLIDNRYIHERVTLYTGIMNIYEIDDPKIVDTLLVYVRGKKNMILVATALNHYAAFLHQLQENK